jgi:hypothetical protein
LTIGAPTSGILAEMYLQYIENTYIYHILQKHTITSYNRCVDDIIIFYDTIITNITHVLNKFNKINNNLKFTTEDENNTKNNFLHIKTNTENTKLN